MRYAPSYFVVVPRLVPITRMFAPTRTSPELWSLTVPRTSPENSWANASNPANRERDNRTTLAAERNKVFFISPPSRDVKSYEKMKRGLMECHHAISPRVHVWIRD